MNINIKRAFLTSILTYSLYFTIQSEILRIFLRAPKISQYIQTHDWIKTALQGLMPLILFFIVYVVARWYFKWDKNKTDYAHGVLLGIIIVVINLIIILLSPLFSLIIGTEDIQITEPLNDYLTSSSFAMSTFATILATLLAQMNITSNLFTKKKAHSVHKNTKIRKITDKKPILKKSEPKKTTTKKSVAKKPK